MGRGSLWTDTNEALPLSQWLRTNLAGGCTDFPCSSICTAASRWQAMSANDVAVARAGKGSSVVECPETALCATSACDWCYAECGRGLWGEQLRTMTGVGA
jgi:hypothetical protein